jgi:hypothetical protein
MAITTTTTLVIRKRDFLDLLKAAGYPVTNSVSVQVHREPTDMRGEPQGFDENDAVVSVSWPSEACRVPTGPATR